MKKMIVGLTLLFATLAQAKVHFAADSNLPQDFYFREKLAQAILKACPDAARKDQNIVEISTEVRTERIDQGIEDLYFSSVFSVYATDEDGYHPRTYPIHVNTSWISGNNPSPYDYIQIEPIQGCR